MKLSKAAFWVPFAFCAFLSLMRMFIGESVDPAFYAFLPMCFFFVGGIHLAMWNRIVTLERALRETAEGGETVAR